MLLHVATTAACCVVFASGWFYIFCCFWLTCYVAIWMYGYMEVWLYAYGILPVAQTACCPPSNLPNSTPCGGRGAKFKVTGLTGCCIIRPSDTWTGYAGLASDGSQVQNAKCIMQISHFYNPSSGPQRVVKMQAISWRNTFHSFWKFRYLESLDAQSKWNLIQEHLKH